MKKLTAGFAALILLLAACGQGSEKTVATWEEKYDLGVRYLSEGNYEEAIIAFSAAIEIDPKRAEAYIGLADTYIGQNEYTKALKTLRDSLTETDNSQVIANKIAEIEKEYQDNTDEWEERIDLEDGFYEIERYNREGIICDTMYNPDDSIQWQHTYDDIGRVVAYYHTHNYGNELTEYKYSDAHVRVNITNDGVNYYVMQADYDMKNDKHEVMVTGSTWIPSANECSISLVEIGDGSKVEIEIPAQIVESQN